MAKNRKSTGGVQLSLFADEKPGSGRDEEQSPSSSGPARRRAGRRRSSTERGSAIDPAPQALQHAERADRLPRTLRMGTSSWSFPGWDGLVYQGAFSESHLARHGLAAYARHPLFRAVGIDRTYYAPISAEVFASYAGAVPDDFRFLAKAHELCTLARLPRHDRHGSNKGELNSRFLDPAYARDAVVEPFATGLGDKAGPLLFQLAPQSMEALEGPLRFAERLHRFLTALPRGPLYAVEVRNTSLLTRDYAEALADAGACHCINLWGRMPPPAIQAEKAGTGSAPAVIIRWMLVRHMRYQQARDAYAPFNAIVDRDQQARNNIVDLIRKAENAGQPTYVIVNNKAEGSAPLSIAALAELMS